jgi:hypothetical protein
MIIERNLALVRRLRALGATHADLVALLNTFGIATADGRPL